MNKVQQAIILNSGVGKRMGEMTNAKPKALLKLSNDETLLSRQIRILKKSGIKEFIITTGPFHEQIQNEIKNFKDIEIKIVHNPLYDSTNNIYSLWLIRKLIKDYALILHGDLVFNQIIMDELIKDSRENLVLVDYSNCGHAKDFKAFMRDDQVIKIEVSNKTDDNLHMQPIYSLNKYFLQLWLNTIGDFIRLGNNNVYMEDALNQIIEKYPLNSFEIQPNHYIDEIDTPDDFDRINKRLFEHESEHQMVEYGFYVKILEMYLLQSGLNNPLIVHGKHLLKDETFLNLIKKHDFSLFSDYSYNPTSEDVLRGLRKFQQNQNDSIIAIAGGSGMDVAKAIKFYFDSENIKDPTRFHRFVDVPLVAIPTTAGTGSEATTFAVIYFQGKKQSIDAKYLLPNYVILDERFLDTLPTYQRKSTLLDAFSQSIESIWSVQSNKNSLKYALKAIDLILKNYRVYIRGDNSNNKALMRASNLAGKAINISKTTAPHAMSYAITSMKGISHGHAVALTMSENIKIINKNFSLLNDRSKDNINKMLDTLKIDNLEQFRIIFESLIDEMQLKNVSFKLNDIYELTKQVNLERLANMPIKLKGSDLTNIYFNSLLR